MSSYVSTVLLTGSTGFIGSRMLSLLVDLPCRVILALRPGSDTARIDILLSHDHVEAVSCATYTELAVKCKGKSIDALMHFAWCGVPGRERDAFDQFEVNVPSFINILEVVRLLSIPCFVSLGSQAEYGPFSGMVSESEPDDPVTLYAKAKTCCRHIMEHYCSALAVRSLWFRVFPLYGPGEREPWLIPSLVASLRGGCCMPMTAGEQVRDYLHVDDAVRGIVAAWLKPGARGVYNLCSGQGVSVKSLAESVRDAVDPELGLSLGALPYRADQADTMIGSNKRLVSETGWRPQIPLDEGIQQTVAKMMMEMPER